MTPCRSFVAAVAISFLMVRAAHAGFHLMQIEQVIGGVNGDTTSQAIQLRMRSGGQTVVSAASLWAADAAGANRVLLLDIAGPSVSNGAAGDRVLLTTNGFKQYLINHGSPTFTPDFVLANPIPSSYLTAGRLTFEADGGSVATPGTIYWSLSWGGAGYTGSTTGDPTNDSNSNFGPSFGSALPTSTRSGVLFQGTAGAASNTNQADYLLSANPATVTENSHASFVIPTPEPSALVLLLTALLPLAWVRARSRRIRRELSVAAC